MRASGPFTVDFSWFKRIMRNLKEAGFHIKYKKSGYAFVSKVTNWFHKLESILGQVTWERLHLCIFLNVVIC
jgi:hypothetical protein